MSILPFSLPGLWRQPDAPPVSTACHRFDYPLDPAPRTAVLGWPLTAEPPVTVMDRWTVKQLEAARPEALAGSMRDLIEVAALREMRVLKLRALRYPLVVITRAGEARLSEADHDRLWRLFRLPVFEQIRDARGRLVAWECESRKGFHFAADVAKLGGPWDWPEQCGCGSTSEEMAREAAAAG